MGELVQVQVNEISVDIKKSERVGYGDNDSDSIVNEEVAKGVFELNGNINVERYNADKSMSAVQEIHEHNDDGNSTGRISDISEGSMSYRYIWKRLFREADIDENLEAEWDDLQCDQAFLPFSDRSLLHSDAASCQPIGLRERIANSYIMNGDLPSRIGRLIRRRSIGGPEHYMTLASELNNVAADLYCRKQFSTAMDLLKDAVKAVKTALSPDKKEWQELASLDDNKNVARKIVQGKEIIQNIDAKDLPSTLDIPEPSRLDIFHWPKSVQSQGPKWLTDPMYVALQAPTSTDCYGPQDKRQYGCIGAFILFNLGLIYLQRQEFPAALKYFQMAIDLVPKDYSEHFHQDYIVFISLHNNIGCIEYQQSFDSGMGSMCQVSLQEFQFAFHLCRFYRASLRDCESAVTYHLKSPPAASIFEEANKTVHIHMGTIAANIARVYFDRKQDDEAIDLCNDALESFISAYGEGLDHIDVATEYYNLGVTHHRNENYEKAMDYYNHFFRFIGTHQSNKTTGRTNHSPSDIPTLYASEDTTTALLNALIVLCKISHFHDKNSELHDLVLSLQTLRCDFGYDHPSIPGLLDDIGNMLKESVTELNEIDYVPYIFDEVMRVEEALKQV